MQVILHIGQPKTATTLVQKYLARHRSYLSSQGLLYPASLGHFKARNLLHELDAETRAAFSTEVRGGFERALLSEERLYTDVFRKSLPERIVRLRDELESFATSWRILCYVRRPDEHVVSDYQQAVKGDGFTGTFDTFFEMRCRGEYYSYSAQMSRWAEVFGEQAVEARLFHRKCLRDSPIADFLDWISVPPPAARARDQKRANESLDRANIEIVRFLRHCKKERWDLLSRFPQEWEQRLRLYNTNDGLVLDTERAIRLQSAFRKDHEQFARRYLSEEHAAHLLAPPREVLPQSPVLDVVHARVMEVYGDAEFADMALDYAAGRLPPPAVIRSPTSLEREAKQAALLAKRALTVAKRATRNERRSTRSEAERTAVGKNSSSSRTESSVGGRKMTENGSQPGGRTARKQAKLAAMNPEERSAHRASARARNQAKLAEMSPEERSAHRERAKARAQAKLATLSPEERADAEERRARKKAARKSGG